MSERGDYSPIARVLRDGPDFQALSPVARHVFYDLKVAFGPCGIEVYYPEALLIELAHTTGWPQAQVAAALEELERAGWIMRERNVVWIVKHLAYHPNMQARNANHAKGVRNHINGLPRLAIVRAFIMAYADFFGDAESLANGYPMAIEGPPKGYRITETETETETETKTPPVAAAPVAPVADARPPRPSPSGPTFRLAPYLDLAREIRGDCDPPTGRWGKLFKRLEAKHGQAEVLRRWEVMLRTKGEWALRSPEDLGTNWALYDHAPAPELPDYLREEPVFVFAPSKAA